MGADLLKCSFTYGQIEEILADIHFIDPERRVAFQGRLKAFATLGFSNWEKARQGQIH